MKLNSGYFEWIRQYLTETDCQEEEESDVCDNSNAAVSQQTEREEHSFLDLPEEMTLLLFQYLPTKDIIR